MLESIKHYAEALSGLTEVSRKRARRIATTLSKQGVIPTGQIRSVAGNIVERSRENRRRLTELVTAQVRRQAGVIGLATTDEIERLRRRVNALEGGGKSMSPPARARKSAARPASKAKPAKGAAKRGTRAAAASKPKKTTRKRTATRKRASTARRR